MVVWHWPWLGAVEYNHVCMATTSWHPRGRPLPNGVLVAAMTLACGARDPVSTSPPRDAAAAGPEHAAHAVPLSADREYFRRAAATDFWGLAPYYVGQQDDVSCSLATLTMIVNSARRHHRNSAEEPLVTQSTLRRRVASAVWEKGLAAGGDGVTLDEIATLAEQGLAAYGMRARVTTTHVAEASPRALSELRAVLRANEQGADDWVLLNFLARSYVGSGDYGHFAPVAAYDARTQRVLVLDPDREWYEPYWIADSVALQGMATADSVTGQPRGYVHVTLHDAERRPTQNHTNVAPGSGFRANTASADATHVSGAGGSLAR